MVTYIKRWYKWSKFCWNSKFYKLLVLLGFVKSPTFSMFCVMEERESGKDYL